MIYQYVQSELNSDSSLWVTWYILELLLSLGNISFLWLIIIVNKSIYASV